MSEIADKEVITQEQFWFLNTYKYNTKQMEYEALRLTNKSKCTLIELKAEEDKNKDKKNIMKYYIIAEGTKQHLLLLRHLMTVWVWGSNFIPNDAVNLNQK